MELSCGNKLCIYFEDHRCILDVVSLDALGVCREIMLIDFDEKVLAAARKRLLEKFEQLEKDR